MSQWQANEANEEGGTGGAVLSVTALLCALAGLLLPWTIALSADVHLTESELTLQGRWGIAILAFVIACGFGLYLRRILLTLLGAPRLLLYYVLLGPWLGPLADRYLSGLVSALSRAVGPARLMGHLGSLAGGLAAGIEGLVRRIDSVVHRVRTVAATLAGVVVLILVAYDYAGLTGWHGLDLRHVLVQPGIGYYLDAVAGVLLVTIGARALVGHYEDLDLGETVLASLALSCAVIGAAFTWIAAIGVTSSPVYVETIRPLVIVVLALVAFEVPILLPMVRRYVRNIAWVVLSLAILWIVADYTGTVTAPQVVSDGSTATTQPGLGYYFGGAAGLVFLTAAARMLYKEIRARTRKVAPEPPVGRAIHFEADTLDQARQQLRAGTPRGLRLLGEEVISNGEPRTLRITGETVKAAIARAEQGVPVAGAIMRRSVVSEPDDVTLTIRARNEDEARAEAVQQAGEGAEVRSLKLQATGRKGWRGIGRRPSEYQLELARPAVVEITYAGKSRIVATFGEVAE
jgi:hypothetical protein